MNQFVNLNLTLCIKNLAIEMSKLWQNLRKMKNSRTKIRSAWPPFMHIGACLLGQYPSVEIQASPLALWDRYEVDNRLNRAIILTPHRAKAVTSPTPWAEMPALVRL